MEKKVIRLQMNQKDHDTHLSCFNLLLLTAGATPTPSTHKIAQKTPITSTSHVWCAWTEKENSPEINQSIKRTRRLQLKAFTSADWQQAQTNKPTTTAEVPLNRLRY